VVKVRVLSDLDRLEEEEKTFSILQQQIEVCQNMWNRVSTKLWFDS
jgi:hypothetical protein